MSRSSFNRLPRHQFTGVGLLVGAWLLASCYPAPATNPAARPAAQDATAASDADSASRDSATGTITEHEPEPRVEAEHAEAENVASSQLEPAPFVFARVLEAPIQSLAFGKAPKIAVLADAPYVFDGEHWTRRELPEAYRATSDAKDDVKIYFGRDNQPRLMGTRTTADTARAIYLRHFPVGWRAEPAELGPLANAEGLYGLLGFADPEVVCAPDMFCLVKRVSGWSKTEADSSPRRMFLTTAGVYKASGRQLFLLRDDQWELAAELDTEPISLCHETPDRLWVASKEPAQLSLRDVSQGRSFTPVSVPVAPQVVHCAGPNAVWAAGSQGAVAFDGRVWQRTVGELGVLNLIASVDHDEIWLGGERGLFVGRRSGSRAVGRLAVSPPQN